MDNTTSAIVDYAMATDFSKLPLSTIHECKRRLVDTFACAVGTYHHPVSRMARAVARRSTGTPVAHVWGCTWPTGVEAAAFANSVMLRNQELNDVCMVKSRGHPSDTTGAVLAVGEALHCDGKSVINAVTLCYDVFCTFCEAVDINVKGLDQTVYAGMASAVAAARLLDLSREQMGHALSIALASNLGLHHTRRGELSIWKGCAAAHAARNGVEAALLAQDGFTGPPAVFEGGRGLWHVAGRFDWRIRVDADTPHRITRTFMKNSMPMAYHGQTPVDAALKLRSRVRIADIAEIRLDTYKQSLEMMANDPVNWAPKNRETADHSLPYVIATALLYGEITVDAYTPERLAEPAVVALMAKIKVREVAELTKDSDANPARLEIRLVSGEVLTSEAKFPRGHIENPMSDGEVEDKFREMFSDYGSAEQCAAALQALWNFEKAADIGDVLQKFVTERSTAG